MQDGSTQCIFDDEHAQEVFRWEWLYKAALAIPDSPNVGESRRNNPLVRSTDDVVESQPICQLTIEVNVDYQSIPSSILPSRNTLSFNLFANSTQK